MEPGSENPGYPLAISTPTSTRSCFNGAGVRKPRILEEGAYMVRRERASMEPGSENPGYPSQRDTFRSCRSLQWSRGPKTPDTNPNVNPC